MQKRITKVLLGSYLALLVWIILFKLRFSLADLEQQRSINLIPFHYDNETAFHAKEVINNMLVFLPVGVYLKMLGVRTRYAALAGFAISLTFETLQFVLACGASDITDVITNTAGALVGAAIYAALEHVVNPHMLHLAVNALAAAATVLLTALLVITVVANR